MKVFTLMVVLLAGQAGSPGVSTPEMSPDMLAGQLTSDLSSEPFCQATLPTQVEDLMPEPVFAGCMVFPGCDPYDFCDCRSLGNSFGFCIHNAC